MKVINFFAGAGAGKSTTSAGLFFLMKSRGLNVELTTEFAKQLVWQERKATFTDQLYILGKQNHKLFMLRDKVDFAISDSPLILSSIYAPDNYYEGFHNLVSSCFNSYNNINFFINRTKAYKKVGRNEDEEGARQKDVQIKEWLLKNRIQFHEIDGDVNAPDNAFSKIELVM